jgi:hypothetical protein
MDSHSPKHESQLLIVSTSCIPLLLNMQTFSDGKRDIVGALRLHKPFAFDSLSSRTPVLNSVQSCTPAPCREKMCSKRTPRAGYVAQPGAGSMLAAAFSFFSTFPTRIAAALRNKSFLMCVSRTNEILREIFVSKLEHFRVTILQSRWSNSHGVNKSHRSFLCAQNLGGRYFPHQISFRTPCGSDETFRLPWLRTGVASPDSIKDLHH